MGNWPSLRIWNCVSSNSVIWQTWSMPSMSSIVIGDVASFKVFRLLSRVLAVILVFFPASENNPASTKATNCQVLTRVGLHDTPRTKPLITGDVVVASEAKVKRSLMRLPVTPVLKLMTSEGEVLKVASVELMFVQLLSASTW